MLWAQVKGKQYSSKAKFISWRIDEDQSKSTTRKFVDTADEHDLLEELLEQSKPIIKYFGDEKYFNQLHYLLYTPFRYPPLKWGSRFGTRLERGILYSSCDLKTAMSEKAFYKLAFMNASEGNIGGKTISHTAFQINIESENFINLCDKPFDQHTASISSKTHYAFSQELGKEMRSDAIECFQYQSARSIEKGMNIGVFSPKVLLNNKKIYQTFEHVHCYSTKKVVEFSFKQQTTRSNQAFPLEQFLVKGIIPLPPT
jgi:hypothetical protein